MKTNPIQDPVQQLRMLLQDGSYPDQSRLPPERNLSEALGISRAGLRKALAVLEAENLIWRHVGRGTFAGTRPKADKKAPLMIADFTNPSEILEARLVLEPKLAAIAALRATPDHIDQMKNALAKSQSATDSAGFELWDGALHRAVAEAAGNSLLISLFKVISSLREDKIWGRLKEASFNRRRQNAYSRQHRRFVTAIDDRNPVEAENAMRNHLEEVQGNLLCFFNAARSF
jgi:DNA-binding FadR family transcriptional regulator